MTVYLYTIFLSSQCKMLMTILSDWHAITSDGHQGKNHRRKHDLFRPIWRPFHWSFMCDSKLRRICNMYVRLVLFIWSYVSLSIWFFFSFFKRSVIAIRMLHCSDPLSTLCWQFSTFFLYLPMYNFYKFLRLCKCMAILGYSANMMPSFSPYHSLSIKEEQRNFMVGRWVSFKSLINFFSSLFILSLLDFHSWKITLVNID